MRNFLKFVLMFPMVIGSMVLAAILVGMSVIVDSIEHDDKKRKPIILG